ncbi:MAG TPA: hypothetical protein DIS90_14965 [Cytophagales bacterium]|nr:hypothetical protein [Cytophagales bacterium]
MKNTGLAVLLISLIAWSCDNTPRNAQSIYFVTLLGNDTLAVEQLVKSEAGTSARVLLRSPKTLYFEYELQQDANGGIASMTRYSQDPLQAFTPEGRTVTQQITVVGDSLISETTGEEGTRRTAALNKKGTLPFIDMVHWPFELAFNAAMRSASDSIHQMLLAGRSNADFIIHKVKADSMTLRHPSRGVMGVTVDKDGNLVKLDAALTTRKLIVNRAGTLDFENIVKGFAEKDKNGSPLSGELSGGVEDSFSFKGADFNVTYGSPKKRGRAIFGGIVSYGTRWRTGANRATHFSTSKNLQMGSLEIPAGEYTLFTIPEKEGGVLIINKQTGQNGQSYDESLDLGRVPMKVSKQAEVTEDFTIKVVENTAGGSLQLIWDQTIYSVDFTIK